MRTNEILERIKDVLGCINIHDKDAFMLENMLSELENAIENERLFNKCFEEGK